VRREREAQDEGRHVASPRERGQEEREQRKAHERRQETIQGRAWAVVRAISNQQQKAKGKSDNMQFFVELVQRRVK
jgi:hypothetical protein